MDLMGKLWLIDSRGEPVNTRLERVLHDLVPRFLRHFPMLKDDVAAAEVMEEAARRVADREQQRGSPIEKPYGYAWVTIRNIATSRQRHSSSRLVQATVRSAPSEVLLSKAQAERGSPEQIEQEIFFREVMAWLNEEEQVVCTWKGYGCSSREIAKELRTSVGAVDTMYCRVKEKMRRLADAKKATASTQPMLIPAKNRAT
jgi:RNA polymerase sigma factor (sigma-70 family)